MLIQLLFSSPLVFFIVAAIMIIAVTIHEFAHAWLADKLGDPTPRYQDRVTLNPLAHLDPIGSLAILFLGFGWGKPVQFDPYNLKDPVKDAALIALAGPVSNIVLALVLAVALRFMGVDWLQLVLTYAIFYNVALAVFNLVPVAPLDGSKILMALLPKQMMLEYESLMIRYSTVILFIILVPWQGTSFVSMLIRPIIDAVVSVIMILPGK